MKPGVRIIAGQWRGSKIQIPLQTEIRPTTDFVRETLFNWLSPVIRNAVCLDSFAGSGILSFEALSRGANKVVAVDDNSKVINHLRDTAKTFNLSAENFEIIRHDWSQPVSFLQKCFDIIFLDPPFRQNFLPKMIVYFNQYTHLWHPGTQLYIEAEKELALTEILPPHWRIVRQKISGQVSYYLIEL